MRQALGSLVCLGRRCLSRIIRTNGGQLSSGSAEYFLHSRCRWDPRRLFAPILQRALPFCPGRYIGVAVDDTRLRKTGRSIRQAFFQRHPLSPPFHVNPMLGLRFLQASLRVPLYRRAPVGARALPIHFEEVAAVKRPRRRLPKRPAGKASQPSPLELEWKRYRAAAKLYNLSRRFVRVMGQLRAAFGSRRFYGPRKFTPEQVRQDDSIPWRSTKIFHGGKRRKVDYKEVRLVYWQGGARKRPLRLLVVRPTRYQKTHSSRYYYRRPAYPLTTAINDGVPQLLRIYFDRWQIEVNHREEKDTLGVGQAQFRNVTSAPKQPAFDVASYSALLLASLRAFGAERGQACAALPKWRRRARRPSALDLVTLLRKETTEHPEMVAEFDLHPTHRALTAAAAA